MKLKLSKEYFLSLKPYIVFAIFLFVLSIILGFIFTGRYPEEAQKIIDSFYSNIGSIFDKTQIMQLLLIFANNAIAAFLSILLGIVFGIVPLLMLFSNGLILGIVYFLSRESFSLLTFIISILPHGIIEIPVLILCGAIGLKIGTTIIKNLTGKNIEVKKEVFSSLSLFLQMLLPLLFVASFIEVYVTQLILSNL